MVHGRHSSCQSEPGEATPWRGVLMVQRSHRAPAYRKLCAAYRAAVVAVALIVAFPLLSAAQNPQDLEASKRRIEEIRAERETLRRQQQRLEGQVQDVGAELRNIERQRESTNRIVNEIERQIGGLGSQVERSSAELVLAEDNLAERRAVLERRLVDIYKRGPLYTWQVLLAAESFGDLLSRYKYLFLTSRQDRSLVSDIEQLRNRMDRHRTDLLEVRTQLDRRREEREAELKSYALLAEERALKLRNLKKSSQTTAQRMGQLERDEARLNEVLAALERSRREGVGRTGRAPATSSSGLTTADIGRLDWPVHGRILYRFGRDTLPSGGVIRWNGIGIGAPAGTPVTAVAAGQVALVQKLSTYGLTVVLEHGNSYYSLYMQLGSASVVQGAQVTKGQVLGTVGGENSDKGPHLHFEIRGENQIALDPTDWLRSQRPK